jgi:UDP-N-acetylglucosamine--N-acetylmuramyl-(pentapeptide) pyrophosphoryl-undecaprenol N-acetylglucosamine transferase
LPVVTVALVCSTGGHLAELVRLRPRFEGVGDVVWITHDSDQSRALLDGEQTLYVPYTGPRQARAALRNAATARRNLRERGVTAVISNGAALAVSYMLPARALRLPCVYIECAARSLGPSLTAKLLRVVPGVRFFTQYPQLESERWRFAGSVLDGFEARELDPPSRPMKIVVTVGSLGMFSFRRLIERLVEVVPADADVVWQTGATDVADLGIDAQPFIPEPELRSAVESSDVVISHAGIGSALMALDSGRLPILVPRLERHGEHVDDHQEQIAAELERRGLAVNTPVGELGREAIERAAGAEVVSRPAAPIALPLES